MAVTRKSPIDETLHGVTAGAAHDVSASLWTDVKRVVESLR